eukprot:366542-Chlamydomonas_euryale.AAC.4
MPTHSDSLLDAPPTSTLKSRTLESAKPAATRAAPRPNAAHTSDRRLLTNVKKAHDGSEVAESACRAS